jgi:acetate kinase
MLIDLGVMAELQALVPLAPLHQPHNLAGITAAAKRFRGVPQIACFDTAFHRTQPFVADTYGLPPQYHAEGIRRFGFHGLSYEYIARRMAAEDPALAKGAAGSGASWQWCLALRHRQWPRPGQQHGLYRGGWCSHGHALRPA